MNKISTDLEQSEKLMELGIDISTADMYYPNRVGMENCSYALPIEWKLGLPLLSQETPTWSLNALMELMSCNCYNVSLNWYGAEWIVKFDDSETYKEFIRDYAVDAVFEMVVWLKKEKYI